jgi:hypothetical protein
MNEKVSEPIRHVASPRNRRKLLHHAKCLRDELEFLANTSAKLLDNYRYALGRTNRIINRIKAELQVDEDK